MTDHGLAADIQVISGGYDEDDGAAAARTLLDSGALPTAVITGNDLCAIGALDTVLRAGIAVPDDLSIIGYDDSRFGRLPGIDLTSVRQDIKKQARFAVKAVVERLDRPSRKPRNIASRPQLIVRGTTAAPRQRERQRRILNLDGVGEHKSVRTGWPNSATTARASTGPRPTSASAINGPGPPTSNHRSPWRAERRNSPTSAASSARRGSRRHRRPGSGRAPRSRSRSPPEHAAGPAPARPPPPGNPSARPISDDKAGNGPHARFAAAAAPTATNRQRPTVSDQPVSGAAGRSRSSPTQLSPRRGRHTTRTVAATPRSTTPP